MFRNSALCEWRRPAGRACQLTQPKASPPCGLIRGLSVALAVGGFGLTLSAYYYMM
jgi:hypothetical protein